MSARYLPEFRLTVWNWKHGADAKDFGIVSLWPQLNMPEVWAHQSVLLFLASLFLLLITFLMGSRFEGSSIFGSSLSLDCNPGWKTPLTWFLPYCTWSPFFLFCHCPRAAWLPRLDWLTTSITLFLIVGVSLFCVWWSQTSKSHSVPGLSLGSSHKFPPCYHVSCHTNWMILLFSASVFIYVIFFRLLPSFSFSLVSLFVQILPILWLSDGCRIVQETPSHSLCQQ